MTVVRRVFLACNSLADWIFASEVSLKSKFYSVWHLNTTYFIGIKKITLESEIIWKLVTCHRITSKKYSTSMGGHLSPQYGQVILFRRYPVWQLSIDHNIDVQYVCNISFPMLPNELESKKLNIGFPVVRTDARCTVTWLPNFLGCVDLLTHGALLARFTRGALL